MKKIIDERGRLFGLISFIDVIVLAVVIVIAVAVFTKFNAKESPVTTTSTVNVTYTIKVPMIRQKTVNLIRPGDKLYNESGIYIGTITGVEAADSEFIESLVDGTFVKAKVYERYDVIMTIEAPCSHSNGRYYADRVFELNANAELWVQTKYVITSGFITSIAALPGN